MFRFAHEALGIEAHNPGASFSNAKGFDGYCS